jgi:cytochrome c-type biogenesis protein CcmH
MMRLVLLLVCLWMPWSFGAVAVEPDEVLADAALEERARQISAGLRCLVCQNQSIDDSDAPLARDLRVLVRERLQAGETDAGVRDYLVARYGDFILLKPPFSAGTWLLWLTPALVLGLGAVAAVAAVSRARQPGRHDGKPLSEEEERRLALLLVERDAASTNLSKN